MGRIKLPDNERLTLVQIRLRPDETEVLRALAKQWECSFSAAGRRLLNAAMQCGLREIELMNARFEAKRANERLAALESGMESMKERL